MSNRKRLSQWKVTADPRAKRIISWLRREPIPDYVIGVTDEDEELKVLVKTPTGKVRWTDVTNTVISCLTIKAFEKEGAMLRVLEQDPEDPIHAGAAELSAQRAEVRQEMRQPGREPIISVDVPLLVRSIAESMKDVAEAAAGRQADAFATGMNAMTSVVNLALEMLRNNAERLEEREERAAELLTTAEEAQLEAGKGGPSTRDLLLQAALSRALGGDGAANGQGNGVDPKQVAALTQLFHQFAKNGGAAPPGEDT